MMDVGAKAPEEEQFLAAKPNAASRDASRLGQQPQQGQGSQRLAGAGFSDDGERLRGRNTETQVAHRRGARKADGEVLDVEQSGHINAPG